MDDEIWSMDIKDAFIEAYVDRHDMSLNEAEAVAGTTLDVLSNWEADEPDE